MTSINSLLGGLTGSRSSIAVNINNMSLGGYEAYIFTLVLRAIRQAGGTVNLRSIGSRSRAPSTFVVRCGPGALTGRTRDFGYASCCLNSTYFEVHSRISWRGACGEEQEMDLSLLRSIYARRLRSNMRGKQTPGPGGLVGAIECKFYNIRLDRDLAQAWVGVLDDFPSSGSVVSRFVSNQYSPQVNRYCNNVPFWRPRYYGGLLPINPGIEAAFVNDLAAELTSAIP
jgi:hypothetical protein